MNPIATYSFLPWLRQGVANTITAPTATRASRRAPPRTSTLQLTGDPVGGGAELTADGRAGHRAVRARRHRRHRRARDRHAPSRATGSPTSSPTTCAAVDFYDEDFPWRYTPAAPDGTGLQAASLDRAGRAGRERVHRGPGRGRRGRCPTSPSPTRACFPPADELWAWAHVHFNQSLAGDASELVSPDMSAVLPRAAVDRGGQPRHGLLAPAVPAPARATTPPTTPS